MLKNKQANFGRHSLNALKRQVLPTMEVSATDSEAQQFVRLAADKSEIFQEVLQKNGIEDKQPFLAYLLKSQCYLAKIKNQIDTMLSQRRLGSNLKGINKDNRKEIELAAHQNLNREAQLFCFDRQFHSDKRELGGSLAQRKEHILREMEQLRNQQIL